MAPQTPTPTREAPEQTSPLELPRAPGAPQPLDIFDALRRYWFLVLLPIVAFAGAAYVIGSERQPEYTATARLSVTNLDVQAPGALAGLAQASQTLASAYSRSVDAQDVVAPVAARLDTTPADVANRVTAGPIPESPVFRVSAQANSAAEAITMANLVSRSLVDYIDRTNGDTTRSQRLYRDYREAALTYNQRLSNEDATRREYADSATEDNLSALERAKADVQSSRLRLETLQSLYQRAQESQTTGARVEVLAPATGAGSDRNAKMQKLVFAGIVAGAMGGMALALLRASRRRRDPL